MADRYKAGYMNFSEIADRLENGKLNAYDVVYTKDTHETIFINENKELIRTQSRVLVFNSVVQAEAALNQNPDTYIGQVVGIVDGEWIRSYNVNYADNKFIVRKMGVDTYPQLGDKPSINGRPLIDNIDEEDPTVPAWAKNPYKPEYTAHEVGALGADDEMPFQEIDRLFAAVFGG